MAYYVSAGTARSENLGLEGPDGVPVLLPHILFDIASEDNYWVVVLLHAALGALDAGLEPLHDALGMKNMLALELLVAGPSDLLKTDGTSSGKVCKTLSVLDGLLFAFGAHGRHRRTVHYLL